MASFTVEFNDTALQAAFKQLAERGTNVRPLLYEIGAALLETTRDRFDAEQSPGGQKWQALNPLYAAYKSAGKVRRKDGDKARITPSVNKILHLSLTLRDSIVMDVGTDTLEISTGIKYARVHQLGGGSRKMPARPFLGVSESDKDFIREAAVDYLTKGF